jgi:hypothetical protein
MKVRYSLLLALAAGIATAQTAPPSQKLVEPSRTTTRKSKRVYKPVAKAPAKRIPKPAAKPMARVSTPKAPEAVGAAPAVRRTAKGRDPFVSPIVRAEAGRGVPCHSVGKKCLAVDQVVLRGIVRAPSGMIAVVESTGRNISYFLRENDPVFNGYVVKITGDAIVFRESTSDHLGRPGTRDVTKRVTAPAV